MTTNLLVSKSRSGGMGITLTPPSGDEIMSEHEVAIKSKHFRKGGRRRASDPNKLMPPSSRSIKKRVSRFKIATYSVMFRDQVLGLEMHPIDSKMNTGAVVTWCHSTFSSDHVTINSIVIGINDELVMDLDHQTILKLIRCSDRPLRLTFHNQLHRKSAMMQSQSLSTWRALDGKVRFRSN
jgi:hypothetical protein